MVKSNQQPKTECCQREGKASAAKRVGGLNDPMEAYTGNLASRRLGRPDPPQVVWDEVVGYLACMLAAPPGWYWVVAGFLAFRFFDIVKPWPIAWLDRRVPGGQGIMVDDLAAAVYAWGAVQLLAWVVPP